MAAWQSQSLWRLMYNERIIKRVMNSRIEQQHCRTSTKCYIVFPPLLSQLIYLSIYICIMCIDNTHCIIYIYIDYTVCMCVWVCVCYSSHFSSPENEHWLEGVWYIQTHHQRKAHMLLWGFVNWPDLLAVHASVQYSLRVWRWKRYRSSGISRDDSVVCWETLHCHYVQGQEAHAAAQQRVQLQVKSQICKITSTHLQNGCW